MEKKATYFGAQAEDEQMHNEGWKSSSNRSRMPVKVFTAKEMSQEMDYNKKLPNVVARLMGLEASVLAAERSSKDHLSNMSVEATLRAERSDVNEVWPLQTRAEMRKNSRQSHNDRNENQIDLVCQKLTEAKRLAANQNFLQSKEFHDAVEVLNSNKDVFINLFEEPAAMCSKPLHNHHLISPSYHKERIIVLKPSKKVGTTREDRGQQSFGGEDGQFSNSCFFESSFNILKAETTSQPTRIVVLKPSPAKVRKGNISLDSSYFLKLREARDCSVPPKSNETMTFREVGSELHGGVVCRQESVDSERSSQAHLPVFQDKFYVGDESSTSRSENCFGGDANNVSDNLASVTSTTGHSRTSISSSTKASKSHRSSVNKEAKKRLSERWVAMSLSGASQEPETHDWSSNTLGEMLAMPEVRPEERCVGKLSPSTGESCSSELVIHTSATLCSNNIATNDSRMISPENLPQANSCPLLALAFRNTEVRVVSPETPIGRPTNVSEKTTHHLKSTFKGKISSLFFPRTRAVRDKSFKSPQVASSGALIDNRTEAIHETEGELQVPEIQNDETGLTHTAKLHGKEAFVSSHVQRGSEEHSSGKTNYLPERSTASGSFGASEDQLSPLSVLDLPFKDDARDTCDCDNTSNPRLLSRSPPIESIARTLSLNDGYKGAVSSNASTISWTKTDEEQEKLEVAQRLMLSSGFDNEKCTTIFNKWHSLESPLNPLLVSHLLELNGGSGQSIGVQSPNWRLTFESVNEALVETGNNTFLDLHLWLESPLSYWKGKNNVLVTTAVYRLLKSWQHYGNEKLAFLDTNDTSQIVNRLVKSELVGRKWDEIFQLHMDSFSKEICERLLDDLIGDTLAHLTS